MTRLRIDADGITALGSSLSDHARALEEISALPQIGEGFIGYATAVSYTHLTLPTNREV